MSTPSPIPPAPAPRHFVPLARLRWLILGLLFFSTVINYVDRQALSVLLPTLRTELHLSSIDYGNITTVFMLAYTVGQLLAGVWIDKVGTRRGFAFFISIWSVAAAVHAFARGTWSLMSFRALLGLSEAGNWPAGGKAVAQWFPPQRRAFAMAVFDGGSAVGAIIAPPAVAYLAIQLGWRSAFVVTGVLGFLWLAAWWWIYDAPDTHKWLSPADRAQARQESGEASPRAKASFGAALGAIVRTRSLWGLMATRLIATPVWWFYVFWLPDYLSRSRGFSLAEIGLYAWIPFLTVDLGKLTGGSLSDRLLKAGKSATFARKVVMVAGALLMVAGIQVAQAPTAVQALVWVCLATFGFGMWSANILALHADIFPATAMASAVGLTGMAASLGGAAFTFLVGRVVEAQGYGPAFWIAGLLALFAAAVLIFGLGPVRKLNLDL